MLFCPEHRHQCEAKQALWCLDVPRRNQETAKLPTHNGNLVGSMDGIMCRVVIGPDIGHERYEAGFPHGPVLLYASILETNSSGFSYLFLKASISTSASLFWLFALVFNLLDWDRESFWG